MKYEIYLCDVWGDAESCYVNDVMPMGIVIDEDEISEDRLCEILGLGDSDKIEIDDLDEDTIFVDYDGKPYCELRRIDDD